MTYGIRLTGTERDLAALHALATLHAELVVAPWTSHAPADDTPASLLTSEKLTRAVAESLAARGVDVVGVTFTDKDCAFSSLREPDASEQWTAPHAREAPSLVEALRPVPVHGDPDAEEAIFRAPLEAEGAQRTLERLLSLKRDDFTVAEVITEGARELLVRVARPPKYLLLRAREEPAEGVRAYARVGDGSLWVEWSWAHPLADVVARLLPASERVGLVDRAGRWRFINRKIPWKSVYEVVTPRFETSREELVAARGEARFTVRLRLGAGPTGEPELWILDEDQMLTLESLIESLTPEEVSRFTVARTTGADGTRYVLQELVRPGASRLGLRVSELAGVDGHTRAAGTDNLYLPVGRQLLPRMRRDELRALLELDRARVVVVSEDRDGPRVTFVRSADEVSLSRWVDYVATDRRMELDRIDEASVFDWPELTVEKAVKAAPRDDAQAARPEHAPPPRRRRPEAEAPDEGPEIPVEVGDEGGAEAALREEIRALELVVAEGGCDVSETWRALSTLKARVGEWDDAATCLESAVFFGSASLDDAVSLVALRAKNTSQTGLRDEGELALRGHLAPGDATWLGARVLERSLRGEALVGEGFFQQAERALTDPEASVSRRLAWAVARALHARTSDRLGLTRARERILGGVNDRGLSDTADMPRFVRFALAVATGDDAAQAHARDAQLAALEELCALALQSHVREREPKGAYLRLVFAIGFARLGAAARGRDLLDPVERDESEYEAPNRALFKLYRARYAHVVTQGDAESWRREVDGVIGSLKDARTKDRVEWLRKRSEWLRFPIEEIGVTAKPTVRDAIAAAEAAPELASATVARLLDDKTLYDYEARIAVERLLKAALRSGNDERIADVLRAVTSRLDRVKIPEQRGDVIAASIRVAATLGDSDTVDRLLDEIVTFAHAPAAPSARDVLVAVRPAIAALRRLGAGASARRFLDALLPVARRGQREGVKLRAALADGFLQVKEGARADELLDECLDDTLDGELDHPGRYDVGAAVLAALRHWPVAERARRCGRVLAGLDRFKDTFTASTLRLYETHKVLIAERVVDAVVDDVTFQGDRLRAFLDEEEQALRRRILADWREQCGR